MKVAKVFVQMQYWLNFLGKIQQAYLNYLLSYI